MGRHHLAIARKYCHQCKTKKKFERNAGRFGLLDLLLTLGTFGLWLVPKWVGDGLANPWRCAECGRREGRLG